MDDLKTKLQSEIEVASWSLIAPHHARETVYYLNPPNDLVQMGMLIADNKTHLVKAFMDIGDLKRPSDQDVLEWSNDSNLKFKFLIIQPFVLIQKN